MERIAETGRRAAEMVRDARVEAEAAAKEDIPPRLISSPIAGASFARR